MSNRKGITFSEKMAGPVFLGSTDYETGETMGRKEGSEFAMHGTITIEDMDKFITDPAHTGQLEARFDFTPFGENLPARTGIFNLFCPTDDPKLKLMVYEFGFSHDGKDYYFAGKKKVKNDPGFDLWKDTTTLFSNIHQGNDKSGPIVASGILTLGVADLIRLLKSMKAINVVGNKERVEAFTEFGKFFLGQLWDTYCKHIL